MTFLRRDMKLTKNATFLKNLSKENQGIPFIFFCLTSFKLAYSDRMTLSLSCGFVIVTLPPTWLRYIVGILVHI